MHLNPNLRWDHLSRQCRDGRESLFFFFLHGGAFDSVEKSMNVEEHNVESKVQENLNQAEKFYLKEEGSNPQDRSIFGHPDCMMWVIQLIKNTSKKNTAWSWPTHKHPWPTINSSLSSQLAHHSEDRILREREKEREMNTSAISRKLRPQAGWEADNQRLPLYRQSTSHQYSDWPLIVY